MNSKLPPLTSTQFLILSCLGASEMKGRELRAALKAEGVLKSAPAFYQMMARLEDAGFVSTRKTSKVIEGTTIHEQNYKMTGHGARALRETSNFYSNLQPLPGFAKGGLSYA